MEAHNKYTLLIIGYCNSCGIVGTKCFNEIAGEESKVKEIVITPDLSLIAKNTFFCAMIEMHKNNTQQADEHTTTNVGRRLRGNDKSHTMDLFLFGFSCTFHWMFWYSSDCLLLLIILKDVQYDTFFYLPLSQSMLHCDNDNIPISSDRVNCTCQAGLGLLICVASFNQYTLLPSQYNTIQLKKLG